MDTQPETVKAPHCRCIKCLDERKEMVEVFGIPRPASHVYFIVCQICGNKRCPHSDDHNNPCTNSNEPGQKGSRYE